MRAIDDALTRFGSLRFDEFVELALYDPDDGFFSRGGGAGRRGGDFVTSPEVGPLFGAVVARWLDQRWNELGRPDPFVVVEAAAGRGALAIAVLAAAPESAPALRYVLVERSPSLRERQADHLSLVHPFELLGPDGDVDGGDAAPMDRASGPLVCSLSDLPATPVDGAVIANELLDNVPFRLFERADHGWDEVRVARGTAASASGLEELLVPAGPDEAGRLDQLVPHAPVGSRVPLQAAAARWVTDALEVVRRGSVLLVDYAATTPDLATRPMTEWVRTYRGHERGGPPLDAPGTQDITVEVAVDQLDAVAGPSIRTRQADWLVANGIDELVEEGRRQWEAAARAPDLAALRARSRINEADGLCDPTGLGGFEVLEWRRG